MKSRTVLTTLLAFLLPLPLVWLLSIVLSGYNVPLPVPQGMVLIPMLSPEERLRLRTYGQDCQTDTDCEPLLRCFYDYRRDRRYCRDSACMTDRDCPEDLACRSLQASNDKELMRDCLLVGARQEGELCESFPALREEACEKGLLCAGFCGRPCRLNDSSSCPEGSECEENEDGPSCVPRCEGQSCPTGQRCITGLLGGSGSVCMEVHGQDCELSPCPPGLHCNRTPSTSAPGKIWMECSRACGEAEQPCPEGMVCSFYQCRQACNPQEPSVCAPGFACRRHQPNQPWACMPSSQAFTSPQP